MTSEAARGGPPPAQQASLLRAAPLLDVPMIMDLCALYGHDNADLTQRLVAQLFEMQPGWAAACCGGPGLRCCAVLLPWLPHHASRMMAA